MGRKRNHARRPVEPVPPKGLRPPLYAHTRRALATAHHQTLDDITRGGGTEEALWAFVGSVLTFQRLAEMLEAGVPEMEAQHTLAMALAARHASTGRVVFTGPEYTLARQGVMQMELLAEIADHHTALRAANWAEDRTNQLRALHQRHAAAEG